MYVKIDNTANLFYVCLNCLFQLNINKIVHTNINYQLKNHDFNTMLSHEYCEQKTV